MNAALRSPQPPLIERLPEVRGRVTAGAPLDRITWFRAGGCAEGMFKPAAMEDLAVFLKGLPIDVPVTVLGVGSNLLVRDGGVPGVLIRLGAAFAKLPALEYYVLEAGEIGRGHV